MANRFIKGLFKDTSPGDQPEGTWRYAKNMTVHPMDGAISTERGINAVTTMGESLVVLPSGETSVSANALNPESVLNENGQITSLFGGAYLSDIPDIQAFEPFLPRVIVGTIEITDDRVILFMVYDLDIAKAWIDQGGIWGNVGNDIYLPLLQLFYNNGNPMFTCEIGEWDGKTYTRLYRPRTGPLVLGGIPLFGGETDPVINPEPDTDQDLNFSKHYFIEGTYKKNPDGELFVYWTDDLNPPRVMNITRQKKWLRSANWGVWPEPTEFLYGIDPYTTPNPTHGEMLNLFPSSGPVPHVDSTSIEPGGGLLTGVYYLALAYVDQDLVQTNFLTIANPVSLVEDVEGVLPIERYDGSKPKSLSGKAISWFISNINTDYEYIRPTVIRKADGASEAFKLNDIPTNNLIETDNSITFTGLEGYTKFNVEDVIVDTVSYDTAKTITQLDGNLYLGNLKGSKDLGYQKYANFIRLCPELKEFEQFDPHEITTDVLENGYLRTSPYGWDIDPNLNYDQQPILQGYRWNENIFKYKGYTRDEVYAFYIAFIMNNGTESYAYHIPGRAPLRISEIVEVKPGVFEPQYENIPTYQSDPTIFQSAIDAGAWESYESDNLGMQKMSDGKGRLFHFYETSLLIGANNMNFWQNANEFYPTDELNKSNWEVWDAFLEFANPLEYEGEPVATWLQGKRVRHHHFPSNENKKYQVFGENESILEIDEAGKTEWFSLDFSWCRSNWWNTNNPNPGNNDLWGGDDSIRYTLNADGNPGDVIGNLESNYPLGTINNEFEQQALVLLKELKPGIEDGGVWPSVGDSVHFWFGNMGGGVGMAADRFLAGGDVNDARIGSYDPEEMYGGTQTLDAALVPGNWTNGSSENGPFLEFEGDFYAQGGNGDSGIKTNKDCDGYHDHSTYGGFGCLRNHKKYPEKQWGCVGSDDFPEYQTSSDTTDCMQTPVIVVWANDSGDDGLIILKAGGDGYLGSMIPKAHGNTNFSDDECKGFISWKEQRGDLKGPLKQTVRALGFSLHDLKIPDEIAEKTQGFRIYHAKRNHNDRRILGQNLFHPYGPTNEPAYPSCIGVETSGLDAEDEEHLSGWLGTDAEIDSEKFWINWPVSLPGYAYPSQYEGNRDQQEYQSLSFHDFYLMRSRNTIVSATHIKVDYLVNMIAYVGPGISHKCSTSEMPWDPSDDAPENYGVESCWGKCLEEAKIISGYHVGYEYKNALEASQFAGGGGTDGQTLYNFFMGVGVYGDINRPIKERCKNFINGDSLFNGKQLGFGYKSYNEFGESHIKMMLNEKWGVLPVLDPVAGAGEPEMPNWIRNNVPQNYPFVLGSGLPGGATNPMMYQGNLHAFRQDMYNSIDTQDLVWTGFEVTGDRYKKFIVSTTSEDIIEDFDRNESIIKYDTIEAFTNTVDDPTGERGKIFGGDTFLCRHGYRKTLRDGLSGDTDHALWRGIEKFHGRDMRFLYETIVESTDNINFRHVESLVSSYFPGTPAKEVLKLDNLVDGTDVDNMKYNTDYSAVNDVGHTVPLPLQVSQPSEFPTRVIRSARSDDSTLIDNYRVFLAAQLKDLPKNRGDLWKISVFNNLLYFHMQDSIFKTKGKQTLELQDKSEAFIGSGDLFVQEPEELIQTESGYGGTQSQFAALSTRFGYFFLDQRNRKVFMITDQVNEISSLGMEKWFNQNIPYVIEQYGAKPPLDNPYTFGFHAVWDEEFQRILLTKRELIPTEEFTYGISKDSSEPNAIMYNTSDNHFYIHKMLFISGVLVIDQWEKLSYSYMPHESDWYEDINIEANPDSRYFEPGGWSISYHPQLGFWVSFHDDSSYIYMTLGNRLFSFTDFAPLYVANNDFFSGGKKFFNPFTGSPNPYQGVHPEQSPEDVTWLGNQIWEWHNTSNDEPNSRFKNFYTREIEVIHNEHKDINKLFYNFSFDVDLRSSNHTSYQVGQPYGTSYLETTVDRTEVYQPPLTGFSHFIVWNSFQNSGERQLDYLQNLRRNASDWCVSKFRDRMKRKVKNNPAGGTYLNPALTDVEGSNQELNNMWNIYGMNEILNASMLSASYEGKKFVDKWIALRLICKTDQKSLNLLSTKVGIRKYPRHEHTKQTK